MSSDGAQVKPRIAYVCLQATREGQASYAHVHEIIGGLERAAFTVDLYEPRYARSERMPGPLGRLWEFLVVQARVLLRLGRYDALYIRSHFATLPTVLVATLMRIPKVYEVNGPHEDLFVAWPMTRRFASLFKWISRAQVRRSEAVVTVTQELRHWLQGENPGTNVFVIPNGANTALFNPEAATDLNLPSNFALFFGALAPWQGLSMVIEAVQRPEWPEFMHLVVVGDGAMRPLVEAEATQNPKVHYLGKQPYRKVPGIVAASQISLVSCGNPGGRAATGLFPLKLFESLAAGTPVVVTDFPGQADLVREIGCGYVVPSGDAGALASAVAWLVAHPEEAEAMGRNGREAVVAHHSWDRRAADTAEVLMGILQTGGKA